MSFTNRLERELVARRVRPSIRRRIVLEYSDHVACEPASETRLGDPAALAATFAGELAADDARHDARNTFLALSLAAVALLAGQLSIRAAGGYPGFNRGASTVLGLLASLIIVIAPQMALGFGSLAALRALRRRRAAQLPDAEVVLMHERCSLAAGAGLVLCAGLFVYVLNFTQRLAGWWLALQAGLALIAAAALIVTIVQARHWRTTVAGIPGDPGGLDADLPRLAPVLAHPRTAALATTLAGFAAVTALGTNAESSLIEGLERGTFEALVIACGLGLLAWVTRTGNEELTAGD
jgi:hypothetical protein